VSDPARLPPLLVIGIGNPSRGDDALGPAFIERAEASLRAEIDAGEIELMTDFQLQVEHALDLVDRARVVFVDASVKVPEGSPFTFERATPERDESFSSHALSPAAVLDALRALGHALPDTWVLGIRATSFELGEPIGDDSLRALDQALERFVQFARVGT
jgi:hydrogenase maturation protease